MRHAPLALCTCAAVVGLGWVVAQDATRPGAQETPSATAKADAAPASAPADPRQAEDLRALRDLVERFTAA